MRKFSFDVFDFGEEIERVEVVDLVFKDLGAVSFRSFEVANFTPDFSTNQFRGSVVKNRWLR